MIRKLTWPFDISLLDRFPEGTHFASFLEAAANQNCTAYITEESAIGALAHNGRGGEIVRRGGRGRWWEIIFEENQKLLESRYVDGFESAAEAVLSWLRGEPATTILSRIEGALVQRPGGLTGGPGAASHASPFGASASAADVDH